MNEDLKHQIISFCDKLEIEYPKTKDEIQNIINRMVMVGLLSIDNKNDEK